MAGLSAEEQVIVKRHSGSVGWQTVLLAFGLLAIDAATITLWAQGRLPLVVGLLVNSYAAYAAYTIHHDATHKSISGRQSRWAWLDTACGVVASAFLLLEFKSYAANHLRHHAHTNKLNDPDLLVKGPLWQLPMKWAFLMTMALIGSLPLVGDRIVQRVVARLAPPDLQPMEDETRFGLRRINQVALVVVLASIPLGAFVPVFVLWYLPSRIGILYLMVLFQWLPHFPFDRTDRWGNTRVTRWPGSTWMMLQQDRHLVHHLYPSLPWFRYRAAFRELRPILEANGAVLQGVDSAPRVPIQLREAS